MRATLKLASYVFIASASFIVADACGKSAIGLSQTGGAGGRATGGGGAAGGAGSGGIANTGGAGGGGGGSEIASTGGVGAGGTSKVDASPDAPSPAIGMPCESDVECDPLATHVLWCQAPGEPRPCNGCQGGTSNCASDTDCAPDGGPTTGKMICNLASADHCYCNSVKLCVAGCRTNTDCPSGQACNATNSCQNTCVAGEGTCPVDFSCGASGFCQQNICSDDSQCSVACVGGSCYGSRGTCQIRPY